MVNRKYFLSVALSLAGGIVVVALVVGGFVFYQLWRHEVFVAPTFDETPPELPADLPSPSVLVFSKTNSFRHVDGIPAANALFSTFAKTNGWSIFFTENAAVHNAEALKRFDLLIWNNVSGDVLTPPQRVAFKDYVEQGGRVLAIHASGGDPHYAWDWYPEKFICAQFVGHPLFPQFQEATVKVEMPDQPAMENLPASFAFKDEWYSFAESPRGKVNVLASLDEASYSPSIAGPIGDLRMGDHPVIWWHKLGKGTVFYSALGHRAAAYKDENYQKLLLQAALWLINLPT